MTPRCRVPLVGFASGLCLLEGLLLGALLPSSACRRSAPPAAGPALADAGKPLTVRPHPRRIDVHTHISPDGIERALHLMDEWGIDGAVNLSGMNPGPPRQALETQLAAAAGSAGRIAVFTTPDFRLVRLRPDYGRAMAAQLEEAHRLGAIGLKITKG